MNNKRVKGRLKKAGIILLILCLIFCTGCGGSKSDRKSKGEIGSHDKNGLSYSTEAADMSAYEEPANEMAYTEDYEPNGADEPGFSEADGAGVSYGNNAGNIDTQMLVYNGRLFVDTMNFEKSVRDFKDIVYRKGGFIESESFSDNYSTGSYYAVDRKDKHNEYKATVRIPSSEYEQVMDSASELGDVRSKKSDVTNVTQEYGTYKSQLEIYQAEYERYLALLEKAEDEEYALQIENELFDIQVKIAELKSGITNIENDVAYSYINITIMEVVEYEEEPEPDDTFAQRFKNTCRNSWENFLDFVEDAIFEIIMNIYAIVFVVIIIIVVLIIIKKKKKQHDNAKTIPENAVMPAPAPASEKTEDGGR